MTTFLVVVLVVLVGSAIFGFRGSIAGGASGFAGAGVGKALAVALGFLAGVGSSADAAGSEIVPMGLAPPSASPALEVAAPPMRRLVPWSTPHL
jgi:hypothetical protein